MSAPELLATARTEGLEVAAHGDRLILRGPRRLKTLADELLSRRDEVLQALHNVATGDTRPTIPAKNAPSVAVASDDEWVEAEFDLPDGRRQQVSGEPWAVREAVADNARRRERQARHAAWLRLMAPLDWKLRDPKRELPAIRGQSKPEPSRRIELADDQESLF